MTPQQEILFWRRSYQNLLNTHNQFANLVGTGAPGSSVAQGAALRTGGAQGTTTARRRAPRRRTRPGGATGTLATPRPR